MIATEQLAAVLGVSMTATSSRAPRGFRLPRPRLRLIGSGRPAEAAAASLRITVRPGTDVQGAAVLVLAGEIDSDSAPRVRAAIVDLITRRRYVVVDLDDATFLDPTLLPELIDSTCSAVQPDVTLLFTSDPRCMLMLKVADPVS